MPLVDDKSTYSTVVLPWGFQVKWDMARVLGSKVRPNLNWAQLESIHHLTGRFTDKSTPSPPSIQRDKCRWRTVFLGDEKGIEALPPPQTLNRGRLLSTHLIGRIRVSLPSWEWRLGFRCRPNASTGRTTLALDLHNSYRAKHSI